MKLRQYTSEVSSEWLARECDDAVGKRGDEARTELHAVASAEEVAQERPNQL